MAGDTLGALQHCSTAALQLQSVRFWLKEGILKQLHFCQVSALTLMKWSDELAAAAAPAAIHRLHPDPRPVTQYLLSINKQQKDPIFPEWNCYTQLNIKLVFSFMEMDPTPSSSSICSPGLWQPNIWYPQLSIRASSPSQQCTDVFYYYVVAVVVG